MKTQTLIIFVILSLSNATFLRGPNPATDISYPTFMMSKIDKMRAALSKFRKSIPSTPQKSFLRFDADSDAPELEPIKEAMNNIHSGVEEMNVAYGDFFDMTDLETAQKNISDDRDTVRCVDFDGATDFLVSLASGISAMKDVRTSIKGMLAKLIGGIDVVEYFFVLQVETEDIFDTEEKQVLFGENIERLNDTLLKSMEDSAAAENDQEKVSAEFLKLSEAIDGLVFKFEKSRDSQSPYMVNKLNVFLNRMGKCVDECVSVSFAGIFGVIACANCIAGGFDGDMKEEEQRAKDELAQITEKMTNLMSSFSTYSQLSVKFQLKAMDQRNAANTFRQQIGTINGQIKMNTRFRELHMKWTEQLREIMIKLRSKCTELGEQF